MGSTRTAQEVEEHHLRKLGPKLGRVYHDLYNDYTYLRLKLKEFRELLGTPQHVDLLNSIASLFFWCVQNIWWESLLLHLCRLTDTPPKRGARQTQTIQMLPTLIRCDPKLSTDVRRLARHACKTTKFARDWRNRRIAHHDGDARPLSEASLKQVDDALNAIHAVFAEIGRRLLNQDLRLDMAEPIYPPKGASTISLGVNDAWRTAISGTRRRGSLGTGVGLLTAAAAVRHSRARRFSPPVGARREASGWATAALPPAPPVSTYPRPTGTCP